MSLSRAIANALLGIGKREIKTLVDEFMYPRLGAGQLYEKMELLITRLGGRVDKNSEVRILKRQDFRIQSVCCQTGETTYDVSGDFFLSSAPLTDLIAQLDPPPPAAVLSAAKSLRYRNHIGVQLTVSGPPPFRDNWIYVHSPDLGMARIADYSNFSSGMAARPDMHPLTVEYFCFPEDEIWRWGDAQLFELAISELARAGIARGRVSGTLVVRSEKAYPVIEAGCQEKVGILKAYLDRFANLLPIGRSGMFKYNNQDHAIATGLYGARRALGLGECDPWKVNIDGTYHESGESRRPECGLAPMEPGFGRPT